MTEVLPGAAVGAVGWVFIQNGFHVYTAYAGQYEAYGALGVALLLLLWLFADGVVLLVGAVVNTVLAEEGVTVE